MEFKLDNLNEQSRKTENNKPAVTENEVFSIQQIPETDGDGYYHVPERPLPTNLPQKKKTFHIPKLVIVLLIIALAALLLTALPINRKLSLDDIVHMSKADIERELDITLTADPEAVKNLSIPNGDPSGFEVYSTPKKDFGVIYYNGKQYGICFDSSKYTLFGVQIGDSESHLFQEAANADSTELQLNTNSEKSYSYSTFFNVIEDMSKGGSTADYILGTDGSVLVLVINDTSHRVVNIIYYYDSVRVMKDIDFF